MAKYVNGKKVSFYSVLGKIGDILLWPILIISLFSSFFMLVQRKQNKITSFFGYSFVNILSGSMIDDGFLVNDTVITKRVDQKDVKLGDVIAFYHVSSNKNYSDLTVVMEYRYSSGKEVNFDESNINYGTGIDLSTVQKTNDKSEQNLKKAQDSKAQVYFHRVIGIYIDNEGNIYFKTKGSNNTYADNVTMGDVVVGKYVYTPVVVRRAVSFCASSVGMILLVCLPLSMLVLMQCLSLIEQISVMSLERKLITGELSYDSKEIRGELAGNQIELYNQVYYYYIVPKEQRNAVRDYLWKDLYCNPLLNEKQKIEFLAVDTALSKLEVSDEAYWNEWIAHAKGNDKRQLIKLKNKLLPEPNSNNTDSQQDKAK